MSGAAPLASTAGSLALLVVSLALVVMVALFIGVAATAIAFNAVSQTATWMLVPYLLWVAFAASLNAWIAFAN